LSFQLESGFFNRCAKDVAATVLGKTILPIQVRPAVAVPVSALSKLAGTYRDNDKLGFSLKMIDVNPVFSWVDSTEKQFVRPVGPSALFLLAQSADLVAEESGPDGMVRSLRWKSTFDNLQFRRVS
jgi:hypothetical protein